MAHLQTLGLLQSDPMCAILSYFILKSNKKFLTFENFCSEPQQTKKCEIEVPNIEVFTP